MPVSPDLAAGLAQATVDHYTEAERLLLARIARNLAVGLDSPTWVEEKLAGVQLLRQYALGVLERLDTQAAEAIADAVVAGHNRGSAAAVADLAQVTGRPLEELADPLRVSGAPAVQNLVTETVTKTRATHLRILRSTVDGYRDVVAKTSGQVLLGTTTRRDAAQRALDELAGHGITGFVDRSGRGWDLASYVEMAVRTSTARAAVNAHAERLQAFGEDLVIVSDAPQECELCRPWEGRVLSLSGAPRIDGVDVAGTLDEAEGAGLFHPGCRHSTSLYQPGVTKPLTRTADPEGDAARRQLRYLERQTRAWKRRAAAALDDDAAAVARGRVRAYQARIREHVASTPAKRQPARERIGAAR